MCNTVGPGALATIHGWSQVHSFNQRGHAGVPLAVVNRRRGFGAIWCVFQNLPGYVGSEGQAIEFGSILHDREVELDQRVISRSCSCRLWEGKNLTLVRVPFRDQLIFLQFCKHNALSRVKEDFTCSKAGPVKVFVFSF